MKIAELWVCLERPAPTSAARNASCTLSTMNPVTPPYDVGNGAARGSRTKERKRLLFRRLFDHSM
jgi:hypothetical protein